MDRPAPGTARRGALLAALGLLLLGATSGPGVELGVEWLNRGLSEAAVVAIMSRPEAKSLVDPDSIPRRAGPVAGGALALFGLALLGRAFFAGRRPKAAAIIETSAPAPVEAIELPPEPAPPPPPPQGTPPGWFQTSPSALAASQRLAAAPDLGSPPDLPERYQLGEQLGAGAMGVVYRAWDQVLGREVAIKVVSDAVANDPEATDRFLREARALAAVSHPGIVILHDVGLGGRRPYLVMELLRGRHLRAVLGELPCLPEKDVLAYGAQVADALACVHAHRLVHRDVKPENILLLDGDGAEAGRVKLMDFGVAHVIRTHAGRQTSPSGTPYYMAPEQIVGAQLGPWTDVYGLGATLFALMAGSLPFPQGEPLYHAVHTPAPDPRRFNPRLSAGTAALLLSCLEKDPAKRPSSAADLATGLRALTGAGGAA